MIKWTSVKRYRIARKWLVEEAIQLVRERYVEFSGVLEGKAEQSTLNCEISLEAQRTSLVTSESRRCGDVDELGSSALALLVLQSLFAVFPSVAVAL